MNPNTQDNNKLVPKVFKEDKELDKLTKLASDKSKYELTEKGEIKVEDLTGTPIFEDEIVMETNHPELMAMWTTIKAIIEEALVPPHEIQNAFQLMEMIAEQEKTTPTFNIKLKVNYFVGLWHSLNTARKFHIFHKDKKLDRAIDNLTYKVAGFLDIYRTQKNQLAVIDNYDIKSLSAISFSEKSLKQLQMSNDKRDKARADREKKKKNQKK